MSVLGDDKYEIFKDKLAVGGTLHIAIIVLNNRPVLNPRKLRS